MDNSTTKALGALREVTHLKAAHWATTEEADILLKRINRSQATLYVECGTCHGYSACWAASSENIQAVHTFDPADREHIWTRPDYADLAPKITFHHGKFHENVAQLSDLIASNVVFYFIDGNHSKRAVAADFDAIQPLLKKGDRIMFHDSGSAHGVVNLMPRIAARFPEWARIDYHTDRGMTEFIIY